MIKKNKRLTHLILYTNELTDYGIELLIDAIEIYNTTIEMLDLSFNKFLTDSAIDNLLH